MDGGTISQESEPHYFIISEQGLLIFALAIVKVEIQQSFSHSLPIRNNEVTAYKPSKQDDTLESHCLNRNIRDCFAVKKVSNGHLQLVLIDSSFNGWLIVQCLSESDASFLLVCTNQKSRSITETSKSFLGESLNCILLPLQHVINGVGCYLFASGQPTQVVLVQAHVLVQAINQTDSFAGCDTIVTNFEQVQHGPGGVLCLEQLATRLAFPAVLAVNNVELNVVT